MDKSYDSTQLQSFLYEITDTKIMVTTTEFDNSIIKNYFLLYPLSYSYDFDKV